MVLFMGFSCVLLHIAVRFGAYCSAFWCILHYVLLHFAVHFGAYCSAFWCISQRVLLQNALQHLAIKLHFLAVADANLGEFFFKEKCKSIVNCQKRR